MNRRLILYLLFGILMTGSVSLQADIPHAPAGRWTVYRSHNLNIRVTVPSTWTPRISSKAVGFRTSVYGSRYVAFGIMKSNNHSSIEQAAKRQYHSAGEPSEWQQTPTRVAGMKAIKIISGISREPFMRLVQYYVQTPKGVYLIECIAPKRDWLRYSAIFSTTISKLQFLS